MLLVLAALSRTMISGDWLTVSVNGWAEDPVTVAASGVMLTVQLAGKVRFVVSEPPSPRK